MTSMIDLDKKEELAQISSVLSNVKRLEILKFVINNPNKRLKEILIESGVKLTYRETLYKYLKTLEDVGLITTKKVEENIVVYRSEVRNVRIIIDKI